MKQIVRLNDDEVVNACKCKVEQREHTNSLGSDCAEEMMLQVTEQHVHNVEEPLVMNKAKSIPNNINMLKSALAGEETTPEEHSSPKTGSNDGSAVNSEEERRESLNMFVKAVITH